MIQGNLRIAFTTFSIGSDIYDFSFLLKDKGAIILLSNSSGKDVYLRYIYNYTNHHQTIQVKNPELLNLPYSLTEAFSRIPSIYLLFYLEILHAAKIR